MQLHSLKPAPNAIHKRKRLGRGEASGKGGTSTKGNKGSQARTGYKSKRAHEGGQMPIQRRVPKYGFNNISTIKYKVFNIGQLDELIERHQLSEISLASLYEKRLIKKSDKVKILGFGALKNKVQIKVNAISASGRQAIEDKGGSVEIVKKMQ